ncbi:MAG: hypothetical protein NT014_07135 [Candidatus Omnitrophica bacterium]|nr:hypothetical protein [Candidatus Omnitrophota bacterium]
MALKKTKKVKKPLKKTTKKPKKITKKNIKRTVKKAKITKKRPVLKKKLTVKKTVKNEGNLIGLITHYFPHVQAAVIKLKKPLSKGDTVKIKGHTTDLTQVVTSIQIDRVDIQTAKKGDEIGLKVISRVRQQDKVYKI